MSLYESMNGALKAEHERLIASFQQPMHPPVFLISQPRAASTLLIQFLLARFKIGYCSNLMSRFWDVPVFGATLQCDLQPSVPVSSFETGLQSEGPLEPHEWGFFWRKWLKLVGDSHYCNDEEGIDVEGLQRVMAAIENVFNAPLIFDSAFVHCNIQVFLNCFPAAIFVWTHREPFYICNSMLNARLKRHGSLDGFYGNRPRCIESLLAISDPVEQVVEQVYATELEIKEAFQKVPDGQRLRIDYPDLMADPTDATERVRLLLSGKEGFPELTGGTLPEKLPLRLGASVLNQKFKSRLVTHFERRFGYLPDDLETVY